MDACRPSPWKICEDLHYWDGKSQLDEIIRTNDLWITHKDQTADKIHRVEMTPRLAMMNRCVFGYVAEILERMLGGP